MLSESEVTLYYQTQLHAARTELVIVQPYTRRDNAVSRYQSCAASSPSPIPFMFRGARRKAHRGLYSPLAPAKEKIPSCTAAQSARKSAPKVRISFQVDTAYVSPLTNDVFFARVRGAATVSDVGAGLLLNGGGFFMQERCWFHAEA
jgi:hypothetical protein